VLGVAAGLTAMPVLGAAAQAMLAVLALGVVAGSWLMALQ
jgi:hypothetical protein